MRLHDSRQYEVSGIDYLIRDRSLGYGFLGRLREKKREGIFAHILAQFIQDVFEASGYILPSLSQGVCYRHQYAAGMGARIGLGPKTYFSGNDRRPQITLG